MSTSGLARFATGDGTRSTGRLTGAGGGVITFGPLEAKNENGSINTLSVDDVIQSVWDLGVHERKYNPMHYLTIESKHKY